MPIPPLAIMLGLGAVAAAFALSSKGSGSGASPLPVDPDVGPVGPGGPGVQPDPSQPFDCAATSAWLAQTLVSIQAAQATCQKNPGDSVCAALPGWQQTWDAVAADYKAHTCDAPGIDCGKTAASLTTWTAQVKQAISACQANPSDPVCGSINGWLVTLGALQDSYTKSCPKTQAEIKTECANLKAWIDEVTPKAKAVGDLCHSGDAQACSDYNAMTAQLASAAADYNTSCGAHL